jgi:hypothetical protein
MRNSLPTKSMFSAEGRMPLKFVGLASVPAGESPPEPNSSTLPLCSESRIGPMNLVFIAAENVAVSAFSGTPEATSASMRAGHSASSARA